MPNIDERRHAMSDEQRPNFKVSVRRSRKLTQISGKPPVVEELRALAGSTTQDERPRGARSRFFRQKQPHLQSGASEDELHTLLLKFPEYSKLAETMSPEEIIARIKQDHPETTTIPPLTDEESPTTLKGAAALEAKKKFAKGLRAVLPQEEHVLAEKVKPEDAMAKNFDYIDPTDPTHAEILHEADHSVFNIKHGMVGQTTGDIRTPSETGNKLIEDIKNKDVDDLVRSKQPSKDSFNPLKSYDSLTGKPQEDDNLMSRQGYSIGDGTPEEKSKFEREGGLMGRDDYSLTEGYASEASKRLSESQADKEYSFADGSVQDREKRGAYSIMDGYTRPKNNLNSVDAKLARQRAKLETRQKEIELMQTKDAVRKAEETERLMKAQRRQMRAPVRKRKREY